MPIITTEAKFNLNSLYSELLITVNKWCNENADLKVPFPAIVKTCIFKDSKHNNLSLFHSDYSISFSEKVHRYTKAICALENLLTKKQAFNSPTSSYTKEEIQGIKDNYNQEIEHLQESISHQLNENAKLKEGLINLSKCKEKIIKIQTSHDVIDIENGPEIYHKQFAEILQYLAARNSAGWTEFMWAYGAPGCGKTHLGKQLAKALGIKPYIFACKNDVTTGTLLGYNNVINGGFVPGWIYEPFKNGGLLILDEGDKCDASILAGCNSIDNDEYCFGNGERVNRHKDFYVIVFANTIGSGSTRGFVSNRLDAATLDRFTQYEMFYDEELELKVYGDIEWGRFVHSIRKFVATEMSENLYVTSRAIRKGAAYLKVGINPESVMNTCIFKGLNENSKKVILNKFGIYKTKEPKKNIEQTTADSLEKKMKSFWNNPEDVWNNTQGNK